MGPPGDGKRLKGLTGPADRTQVSLLPPPCCMETTSESGPAAVRVSPPGITTKESALRRQEGAEDEPARPQAAVRQHRRGG